jgi:hypothetical protein
VKRNQQEREARRARREQQATTDLEAMNPTERVALEERARASLPAERWQRMRPDVVEQTIRRFCIDALVENYREVRRPTGE